MASYIHRDNGNLDFHIDEEWWSTSWINEGNIFYYVCALNHFSNRNPTVHASITFGRMGWWYSLICANVLFMIIRIDLPIIDQHDLDDEWSESQQ
jgi:hypothetical protein